MYILLTLKLLVADSLIHANLNKTHFNFEEFCY